MKVHRSRQMTRILFMFATTTAILLEISTFKTLCLPGSDVNGAGRAEEAFSKHNSVNNKSEIH